MNKNKESIKVRNRKENVHTDEEAAEDDVSSLCSQISKFSFGEEWLKNLREGIVDGV